MTDLKKTLKHARSLMETDPVGAEAILRKLNRGVKEPEQRVLVGGQLYAAACKANEVIEQPLRTDPSFFDHGDCYDAGREPTASLFGMGRELCSPLDREAYQRELQKAPDLMPGTFWNGKNDQLSNLLEGPEIDNFKRTYNHFLSNFFTYGPSESTFWDVVKHWNIHGSGSVFTDVHEPFDRETFSRIQELRADYDARDSREIYNTYIFFCSLLWDYAIFVDRRKVIPRISEPLFGNPYRIRRGARLISQDLARSAVEYNQMLELCSLPENATILEIGSGYGRLAQVFHEFGAAKFIIVDIAPALFLAQTYLHAVFPKGKFFDFRSFENFEDVRREYEEAEFVFLSPNQIDQLPDNSVDLTININSFMEMTYQAVDHYMRTIDRICRGWLYMKQWRARGQKKIDHNFGHGDYPTRPSWKKTIDSIDIVNHRLFVQIWKTR
ncbi:putative sugar O-methyltransferase [Thalassobaculum salexigens]|uniref:putative sugar O-methyltransferase n=1 Tax=Thalassobaculum salexigens TaxID=455360 RepID=UPI00248EF1DE|nr:putative sugar O-methyltransferase [Thalassobaculum salexigens]